MATYSEPTSTTGSSGRMCADRSPARPAAAKRLQYPAKIDQPRRADAVRSGTNALQLHIPELLTLRHSQCLRRALRDALAGRDGPRSAEDWAAAREITGGAMKAASATSKRDLGLLTQEDGSLMREIPADDWRPSSLE